MNESHNDSAEQLEERKANVFEVGFQATAFTLMFSWQEAGKASGRTKIRLRPEDAKLLHFLLVNAIAEYERRFGLIEA